MPIDMSAAQSAHRFVTTMIKDAPDQTLVTKTDAEHMIVRPVRPRTRHTTHSARDSSDEYPQFTSLEMHVSPHTPAWAPHFTERETKRLITKGVFRA